MTTDPVPTCRWAAGASKCGSATAISATAMERAILTEGVSFAVLNLTSDNPGMRWDIDEARRVIGYDPQDGHTAVVTDEFARAGRSRARGARPRRATRPVLPCSSAGSSRCQISRPPFKIVCERRNSLGEFPTWSAAEGALYWVDIVEPAIYRYAAATGAVDVWQMPDLLGSIAVRRRGGLLVALRGRLATFDCASGSLETMMPLEPERPENRCNDGRCDRSGRFWIGTMHAERRGDAAGSLYCFARGSSPSANDRGGRGSQRSRMEPRRLDECISPIRSRG